ncbi:hypothetical protein P170DRAFT_371181, partial [Aspergillus steynii IBT 23096]
IPPGIPGGAMCVQRLDDSLNSAIHINYRISLRSSSMPEPRDPLLKVLTDCDTIDSDDKTSDSVHVGVSGGRSPGGEAPPPAAAWTAGPRSN